MAKLIRQGGYYVEYLQTNNTSRFQEHNAHRDEAMACARKTYYMTRVWKAEGHAVEETVLGCDKSGYYHIDTIIFLLNPTLVFENICEEAFEV
jgi:hypothetical protein